MTALFACIGIIILFAEGALVVTAVAPRTLSRAARLALGYPTGALGNAMMMAGLHIAGLPVTAGTLLIAHGALMLIAFPLAWRWKLAPQERMKEAVPRWLKAACGTVIAVPLIAGSLSAMLLPTHEWDAFTNWTMRAQQIHEAHAIVFEEAAKPQYPVLVHGTQLAATIGGPWSDTAANAATLLLTLTSLLGLGLLLRDTRGAKTALITLSALLAIPLVAVHVRQGLADIHVVEYGLLAAACLAASSDGNRRWLALGAIFTAAAAWTKLDGLYVVLAPWCALLLLRKFRMEAIAAVVLAAPWPIIVLMRGLPLSPHGASFGFHPEGVGVALCAVFLEGSFGVHAWAMLLVGGTLIAADKRVWKEPLLQWGMLSLLVVLATYLGTADIERLTTMTAFGRTMLLPMAMLTVGLLLAAKDRWEKI